MKKSNSKIVILSIIAIIIVILVVALFLFRGGDTGLGQTKSNLSKKNNNIAYSVETLEKEIVVIAKNTTGKSINNIKANFIFYDESNNEIEREEEENEITLDPNEITCFNNNYSGFIEYDHFEVEFSYDEAGSDEISSYANLTYNEKINTDEEYEEYIFPQVLCGEQVKSTHMAFGAIYYKDNKPIYYTTDDVYQLKANNVASVMLSLPRDKDGNIIKYDRFELFIIES